MRELLDRAVPVLFFLALLIAWQIACVALRVPDFLLPAPLAVLRKMAEIPDRLLLHLFQHDVHHRGQAHCMLSGTGVKPPQLDEFFSIAEAPLREAEFVELGWTEEEIWRE